MSNKEQRVAWGPVAAAGSARLASWVGRHVSRMPGPAYATTKHAVLALTHSLNMGEASTVAGALPISCRGGDADPEIVPSAEVQAGMLQPEDLGRSIAFVASTPRVCVNQILISPTWDGGLRRHRQPRLAHGL